MKANLRIARSADSHVRAWLTTTFQSRTKLSALLLLLVSIASASAATRYVWQDSPSPAPPYTTWASAAHVIQDVVNAAAPGDTVLVTNGVYATGGSTVDGTMTNRVAVTKPLTLRSVNGPDVTIIQGLQVPVTTNGAAAVRCVYLTNGASLSGFTLSNGATRRWEDTFDEREVKGGGVWCEWANPVVSNCVLTGNSAILGGGAYQGTLVNCTLSGNSASSGGGAYGGALINCTLADNSANGGGGAYEARLINCVVTRNSANGGGGVFASTLINCTVTGNRAMRGGGGGGYPWYGCAFSNCIVYFNLADEDANYHNGSALTFCCTTPLPPGTGNISADPQLASATHLSASSPCRGAGSAAYASGTDIDGEPWANPPSIGCDEYHAGAVTGPLSAGISASYTNVTVGFPVKLTALIDGRTTASVWEFGDGSTAINQPHPTHAWITPGDFSVILRAYNESHPAGISATVTVHVVAQPVHYVNVGGGSPVPPYTSWVTAATNIQDAVDAATVPGALVLVTNGVYATGGRVMGTETNRVAVNKPLALRSVNGSQFTTIHGAGAMRCVYLSSGASLSGFTLTNGVAESGGAVRCESATAVVSNCVLAGNSANSGGGSYRGTLINCIFTGNSASGGGGASESTLNACTLSANSAYDGGGASGGTLNNCTLTDNTADNSGGGAHAAVLNNCFLTGNSASYGGGAGVGTLNNCTLIGNSASFFGGGAAGSEGLDPCTLNNCIVYFNSANLGPNYYACTMNYCCTTPLSPGAGNISSDPQLANPSHLRANSSCRGAGSAAYATGTDVDGEPWANPPSIGCDEFQAGAATGPLNVSIMAAFTNVATGYPVELTAEIEGWTTTTVWEFGDSLTATNQAPVQHAWTAAGDYAVVLRAYNDSHPAGISATVTVHVVTQPVHYVDAFNSSPVAPFNSWATAATNIQDAVDAATVTGALVLVNDGDYASGGRAVVGTMTNRVAIDRPIVVESVNGPGVTFIQGRKLPGAGTGDGAVRCVYLADGASLSGFTLANGATRNWPDTYDEREMSGAGVWCESPTAVISNCVLTGNSASISGGGVSGGTLNHCTIANNTNGSHGGGAYYSTLNDCALNDNLASFGGGAAWSTLNRCALSGNFSLEDGGAALGGLLNHCTISDNTATYYGGGAYIAMLNNCTLTFNWAVYGGGANYCWLNNCTLTDNAAPGDWGAGGGGAIYCTLNNCIVYFNAGENQLSSTVNHSCTTPLPTDGFGNIAGFGNITNAPSFMDAGNLRLKPDSPCINAGNNAHAGGSLDLDGRPRVIGGTVDMGAYENTDGQTANGLPWNWLLDYGLPTDGSADYTDADADGHNNWQEWKAWTIPTNAFSVLKLLTPQPTSNGVRIRWQSVGGQNYILERATDSDGVGGAFSVLQSDLFGQAGTTSFTDTNVVGTHSFFYRVGVGD